MNLTPAIKGQLTKATTYKSKNTLDALEAHAIETEFLRTRTTRVRAIFTKLMPKEQAKHATRKYLAQLGK